jgi:hypothetical protein
MTKKTQLSFLKCHLDRLTTSIFKRLFLEISLENPFKSIKNIKIIALSVFEEHSFTLFYLLFTLFEG